MQLASKQRFFVDTNYLRTRNFKKIQHLFEQRFQNRENKISLNNHLQRIKYRSKQRSLRSQENRTYAGKHSSSSKKAYRESKNISQKEWFGL